MPELDFEDAPPITRPPQRREQPRTPTVDHYDAEADAHAAFADAEPDPQPEPEQKPAQIVPFRRPQQGQPSGVSGRTMPHSIEAEEFLISCCLLDAGDVLPRCEQAGVEPGSFYVGAHGVIYGQLQDMRRRRVPSIDISTVAEELKTAKRLDEIGGFPFLAQVSGRIATTAQAGYFIEKVRELATLRALIIRATSVVEGCYNYTGNIEEFAAHAETQILGVTRPVRREAFAVAESITNFHYPEGDDPNILLGRDDFLGRGGGMLFVSHAGAGKSSWIMDACQSWAYGAPWMGIQANGALKSLIIQGEDSPRYIGKVHDSFAACRNLTPVQTELVAKNCVIAKVRGISGEPFLAEMERLIELHAPDLVVINPLYIYTEGDISKSDSAQPFLVGLDRINRDARFGYIVVHHTGKPRGRDQKGKRAELDDWETIYMGFGSSFLANWPRCSALLEPKEGESGKYWLKLGKAGRNAGVTKRVPQGAGWREEIVTRVALKHTDKQIEVAGVMRNAIFWEEDEGAAPDPDNPDAQEQSSEPVNVRTGRPKKHRFRDYRAALEPLCMGYDNRKGLNVLHRVVAQDGVGKGTLKDMLQEAVEDGVMGKDKNDLKYYFTTP